MKGVSMVRVKLRPVAECQRTDCGWTSTRNLTPLGVRADAERHVVDTGHRVEVTIRDITEYSPDREVPQ